jgi:hypothetical protein
MNHETCKSIKKVLKRSSPTAPEAVATFSTTRRPRSIYSFAILVKRAAGIGIVSAIGAFSTHGMDLVCLVNSATLTRQSYFRNLSCVTPEYKLPAAPTNQDLTGEVG